MNLIPLKLNSSTILQATFSANNIYISDKHLCPSRSLKEESEIDVLSTTKLTLPQLETSSKKNNLLTFSSVFYTLQQKKNFSLSSDMTKCDFMR